MGRNWDKNEDFVLKELVKIHGKQWNIIAQHLPLRTPSQVAARWEKCLDPTITKGPFTPEEDELIKNYVANNGPRSWPRITILLPHRSSKQCRERWFNHLDPNVLKAPWTQEEDVFIYQQYKLMGGKWSKISKMLQGRTDNAIKNRWNSSISKRLSKDQNGIDIILPDNSKRKCKYKNQKTKTKQNENERNKSILTVQDIEQHNYSFPSFKLPNTNSLNTGSLFTPVSPFQKTIPGQINLFSPNSFRTNTDTSK